MKDQITLFPSLQPQRSNKDSSTKNIINPQISQNQSNNTLNHIIIKASNNMKKTNQSKSIIQSRYLPPIINKTLVKKTTNILSRKNISIVNSNKSDKIHFKPAKSVIVRKRFQQVTLDDQKYLPAFIRNFKLPPRQKKQVIPTLQNYKLRETSIAQYLSPESQLKNYKIISHIGKGSFSIVSMAVDIMTNKKYAIKTYQKVDQIQIQKFQNIQKEIKNLLKLKNHNYIINLDKVIMDKRKILLIMQNGGQQSLAGIMRKRKVLDQSQAKFYYKQILQGLNHCHKNNVCHRDLKLQNILIDDDNHVKIIDFGFSADSTKILNSFCGTPPYMAPEITLRGLYNGKQIDIWSLGVILYVMVYGRFPFRSNSQTELFRLIQQGKFSHNDTISIQLKQVLNRMLKLKAQDRATIQDVLNCSWFNNQLVEKNVLF